MSFAAGLLPTWLNLASGIMMLAILVIALLMADWGALRAVPARLHLVCGATLFCLALWSLDIDIEGFMRVHLLGMTAITLILGWCFALQCGTAALLLLHLSAGEPLVTLPAAWLCSVAVPATTSLLLVRRLARIRRQNLFMYTLGGGFAGGMLSVLTAALAVMVLLALAGQAGMVSAALADWPLITLVLFPEGFINGMLLTAICVFYPGAVKTFDENRYLDGS